MKPARVLILLSACLLIAGCNKGSNTNNSSNVTTTTVNTMNATTSPKASAEVSKSPAETANSRGKVTKAEDAAEGLFNAWKTKDRAAAANFAESAAITKLFSEGGPEGLQFQGCDRQGDTYLCSYYYEGGGLIMNVEGNGSDGYKVVSIEFIAD